MRKNFSHSSISCYCYEVAEMNEKVELKGFFGGIEKIM